MTTRTLAQGRWLALHELDYQDASGNRKSWECVRRVAGRGAASIIATVEKNGEVHLVVVKQFRPPVAAYVLELPAGLIDANEDAAATAERELAEETGFRGQALEIGPFVHNSPGLSDEKTAVVRVAISEEGAPAPDEEEDIEVLLLPLRGLKNRLLEEKTQSGVHLDAKLWCFALGLEVAEHCGLHSFPHSTGL